MNNKSNKLIYYPYLSYLFLLYLCIYIFILFRFSWHKNHGYCWFQTDLDCLNQKPSIVKGDDHGNQGWYCFVVEKYRTQLEARKCSKVTLKYICHVNKVLHVANGIRKRPFPILLGNVWATLGVWSNLFAVLATTNKFCLSEQLLSKI